MYERPAVDGFLAAFLSHVKAAPDKTALIYWQGSDELGAEQSATFGEVDRAARSRAAWLKARYRPGERALLLYPAGLEFVYAFLACQYAGMIAVPAPLPGADKRQIERTTGIARDADVSLVLTASPAAGTLRGQFTDLHVVASDDALGDAAACPAPRIASDSVALLQYTSGSTSEPKGVIVTYANLGANLLEMRQRAILGEDPVVVGWLPHFHDMGLIGMLMYPLYAGATCVFMSPMSFLKRPVRWLQAISRWRGALTTAPDFAYDLCSRIVTAEQLATLDLSSLRWALNGAEPVRATTLDRFSRRFAPAGFRAEAFSPCYGMAEATLMATGTLPATPPSIFPADPQALERNEICPAGGGPAVRLVGCGTADPAKLSIVDPECRVRLAPGQVGEIWLRGGSVTAGYWRQPELTAEVFKAYTVDGAGPCLRTGDLGAVVDGELYVTGRLKDLMIVHGRNLYPQDIEYFVRELHPGLTAGVGAVFAVSDGREHMVVVHELKKGLLDGLGLAELAARVKLAVAKSFDVPAPSVVLANRGAVQRTTSGKVQRGLMRALFLTGQLMAIHEDLAPAVERLRPASVPIGRDDPR